MITEMLLVICELQASNSALNVVPSMKQSLFPQVIAVGFIFNTLASPLGLGKIGISSMKFI